MILRNDRSPKLSRRLPHHLPFRQRGIGFAGWIILVLMFGSLITIGTKLFPIYMEHNTMSNILDKMSQEAGMGAKGKRELREILTSRFKVNNIRNFDVDKNIDVDRSNDATTLIMKYEVRTDLAMNVDLIVSFDKSVVLKP